MSAFIDLMGKIAILAGLIDICVYIYKGYIWLWKRRRGLPELLKATLHWSILISLVSIPFLALSIIGLLVSPVVSDIPVIIQFVFITILLYVIPFAVPGALAKAKEQVLTRMLVLGAVVGIFWVWVSANWIEPSTAKGMKLALGGTVFLGVCVVAIFQGYMA